MSENKRETMAKLLENTRKQLAADPTAHAPILLPVIRNALSSIIADEICSVQPMSSPYNKDEWPYQADMTMRYKDIIAMHNWCRDTLNEGEWIFTVQFFAFNTEQAYAWFMLKWS